jgi:hypothetical protein
MDRQFGIGIKFVTGSVLALASVAVLAAGAVRTGNGGVDQVYGRSSAMPGGPGAAMHTADKGTVSEVIGRDNRIASLKPEQVGTRHAGVDQFGRGSAPVLFAGPTLQPETLAQSR